MRNQRTIGRTIWLALLLWLSIAPATQAQEATRFVEFRDGTRLRMTFSADTIPWRRATADGEFERATLSFDDVQELSLVFVSPSRKLELVRQALEDLKSEDYLERETAQQELLRLGGRYLPVLEKALGEGGEVDFMWRLSAVLEEITAVETADDPGDVYLDAQGNAHEGDLASWSPKASAFGTTLTLDRQQVARIGQESHANTLLEGPTVGLVRRIDADESAAHFASAMHISFEVGPEGSPLKGFEDVTTLYVPWGCLLESSYPESPVAIERGFNVRGPSGGFCAANESPKYRGEMTIRFCQPDQPASPAGVRLVGLWVAEVKPGGTRLEAYDSKGNLLTTITTSQRGSEFLGIESAVPIAYLKLIPNEDRENPASYDPNYAIDDLMFEPPLALAQEFDQYTVVLADGQVLRGSQLEVTAEELRLADLSVGIGEVRVPLSEVQGLLPICHSDDTTAMGDSPFVMLEDGSVLRVEPTGEGWRLARDSENMALDPAEIVALWGRSTLFVHPPSDWQGDEPFFLHNAQPHVLGEVSWGDEWIVAEVPASDEDQEATTEEYTYANSPMVWLRSQPEISSEQGRVRLKSGEEFVFSEGGFQLLEWNQEVVKLSKDDATLEIPLSDVVLLVTENPDS